MKYLINLCEVIKRIYYVQQFFCYSNNYMRLFCQIVPYSRKNHYICDKVFKMDRFVTIKDKDFYSWDYIEHLRKEDAKKRNPYKIIAQRGGQENMLSQSADIIFGGGSRGGSKCMIYSTLVCTPFGFRPISELKPGSIITGRDGRMQRVWSISFNGVKDVYKMTFIDGSSVICSYDHAWTLRKTNYISKKRKLGGNGLEADWRVWTTDMIYKHIQFEKNKESKYSNNLIVPLCDPVEFTKVYGKKDKSIDPYIIGALIGDGCLSNELKGNTIKLTTMDKEIVDNFKNNGINMDSFYKKANNQSSDYSIRDDKLYKYLNTIGLLGCLSYTKFIPDMYKFGTIEERFALVQGLMDTDGYVDKRGHCSYTTISEQLAKDVKFMINSLGGTATISKNKAGYKTADGEYVQCNDAYTIYIKIPNSERLFRLTRKKELCREYNGGVSEYGRRIIDCEYVGKEEVCCIRVENADSLFLVNDFIVTHNSFSLLLEALKDYQNKDFRATIFRREIDDLSDLIDTSHSVYGDFGTYNRSKADMTWNFYSGASLKFNYYSDNYEEFKVRMQGKQYAFIGIDEITHIEYQKFKYLITNNRNAFGIHNRIWGTSNPDPDSWVAKFIDWWIGEDGLPIPERNGVVRYCFMDGDDVSNIFWGNSKEEVYEQCKDTIDKYWLPSYDIYGSPADLFVKSVTFVEAKLADNIQLMRSDPTYLANLAGQSEEQRSRDLEGNWKYKSVGDDMIKMSHMEAFFNNPQQIGDGVRRVSLDAAFEGGDNLVMWLWEGWHIKDLFVCKKDSKDTVNVVRAKLKEWRVLEENFTYDLNGIGQIFKGFFNSAVPFNNRESVAEEDKGLYDTIKSQAAYLFAKKLINKEISIEPTLLDYRFEAGKNKNVQLRQILMDERKAIRANASSYEKGFSLIKKIEMKKFVGHSPDFIEAMFMRMIFEIKSKKSKGVPKLGTKFISPQLYYRNPILR